MSILARLLPQPRAGIGSSYELDQYLRGDGQVTESGALVTPDSAMRIAAVYACVRVIAEDMAALPLVLFERKNRSKERAREHWAYSLLHDEPNQWQTSLEFREMMQAHVELRGNAYALKTIVRNEIRELLPVSPDRMTVAQLGNYALSYTLMLPNGERLPVPADRVFHLRGLSLTGVTGVSPVQYQRELMGLATQLSVHGARVFRNGAQVGGVLEHPAKLGPEASERLRTQFDERYAGASNAHKTLLLEEGMKFSRTGMTHEDAQYLETQKFTRAQVAGIYRVPPHKIGDLERATFSNIEQQSIDYVIGGLLPRLARWEHRIQKDIIPKTDRGRLFAKHLVDGLLRGDTASRYDAYTAAITNGWMSRNEVRELEDMNPEEGLDEFLTPLNMDAGGGRGDEDESLREKAAKRRGPTPAST